MKKLSGAIPFGRRLGKIVRNEPAGNKAENNSIFAERLPKFLMERYLAPLAA
jgi:hypothetical protein